MSMTQDELPFFDAAGAWQDAEEAIGHAEAYANPGWATAALAIVGDLARSGEELTTDQVWERLDRVGLSTHEPRALGGIMRRAANLKWIEATDRTVPGARRVAHRRPIRVWRSRLAG